MRQRETEKLNPEDGKSVVTFVFQSFLLPPSNSCNKISDFLFDIAFLTWSSESQSRINQIQTLHTLGSGKYTVVWKMKNIGNLGVVNTVLTSRPPKWMALMTKQIAGRDSVVFLFLVRVVSQASIKKITCKLLDAEIEVKVEGSRCSNVWRWRCVA